MFVENNMFAIEL